MRYWFTSRLILGLGMLLASGVLSANLGAQPPGPPKKGPKGPPADAEFQTVRGTVREFTMAPKGEVDGLILNDGTWVHWPPHLQDRFSAIAAKGDKVRVTGFRETGLRGDTKLEVSTLTNLDTNKTIENPDRPAPNSARQATDRRGALEERLQALEDKVDRLTSQMERLQSKK